MEYKSQVASSVEELAYEQSLRAMDHQEATLDGLRSRAGTLLAVASLATSFFGVQALDEASDTWATAIAIVLFLGVLTSVLYILWPRKWTFTLSAATILANQRKAPRELPAHYAFLARSLERHQDTNQRKLNTLMKAFRVGSVALAVEVGAWFLPF
jgi:hypothetical protein